MSKYESLLIEMEKTIRRLEEALKQPKDEFIRDSAIQRFEFCFDLAWKTVKAYLEERHGLDVASPKAVWREAFRQKLITYDNFWLELTDRRNETVHTYKEAMAEKVYGVLPQALIEFKELNKSLKSAV